MLARAITHLLTLSFSCVHELRLDTLSRRFAAIGGESRTSAEGCLVGCEKHDHLGNLFGPPCAPERHCRDQAGLPLLSAGKPGQHAGINRSGSYYVDAHTELRCFESCRLSKTFDCV